MPTDAHACVLFLVEGLIAKPSLRSTQWKKQPGQAHNDVFLHINLLMSIFASYHSVICIGIVIVHLKD